MFLWVGLDRFLISYLMYDSLWISVRFYKLPQDYYDRKVLIYLPFVDTYGHSTLHGLCTAQMYKYPLCFSAYSRTENSTEFL